MSTTVGLCVRARVRVRDLCVRVSARRRECARLLPLCHFYALGMR